MGSEHESEESPRDSLELDVVTPLPPPPVPAPELGLEALSWCPECRSEIFKLPTTFPFLLIFTTLLGMPSAAAVGAVDRADSLLDVDFDVLGVVAGLDAEVVVVVEFTRLQAGVVTLDFGDETAAADAVDIVVLAEGRRAEDGFRVVLVAGVQCDCNDDEVLQLLSAGGRYLLLLPLLLVFEADLLLG